MIYPQFPLEQQVELLEKELNAARATIIGLMPEAVRLLLTDYYLCETRAQHCDWETAVVEKVIELAVPPGPEEGRRARCPLCGSEGNSLVSAEGFTLPEGLSMHLRGKSNATPCPVLEQVFAQAREFLRPKLEGADRAEREENQKKLDQRRAVEPLYQTTFGEPPLLIDEDRQYVLHHKALRNEEQLAWAEQRLRELGFQLSANDRVKQYLLETEDVAVLADPRRTGEISFNVYGKPVPKEGCGECLFSFSIRDHWKYDIIGKFQTRLAKAAA